MNKLSTVVHACNVSYWGGISRRIKVQIGGGKNMRPYLANNKVKKG
jgi:hypothetical protein